jgi:two-component system, NarL family, nitrate/nitrite response regulator NarL
MALRALIVDDNAQFLEVARALLERQGMTIVAVASNGEEARRRLDDARPDVVLVDIDLGAESGLDLVSSIAPADRRDRPYVILISAYPEDDVVDLLDASPALGFVSKSSLSATAIQALLPDDVGF